MKDVKTHKIGIRSFNTGLEILDDFYIKVNRRYIHIQGVTPSRVIQIMKNVIDGDLAFCCKNFQIKQDNEKPVKCIFCQRRNENYFIYGLSEEKRNLCVCKKHLPFLYDSLVEIIYHGNCNITSNKEFKC